MAIMDKIMFWKHNEPELDRPMDLSAGRDPGLGSEREFGLGMEDEDQSIGAGATPRAEPSMPPGYPSQGFQQQISMPSAPMPPPGAPYPVNRDMELVSAKLDALKAALETINQRLANIERMAREGI